MFPVVRLTLSLLRLASHASLFVEAQRLLLRLLRPALLFRRDSLALESLESHLLKSSASKVSHLWLPDKNGHKIHVLQVKVASTSFKPETETENEISEKVALLLHGHSMSAAFWYRNFDTLVAQGFTVFAVDMLGWGRSQRAVPPSRFTVHRKRIKNRDGNDKALTLKVPATAEQSVSFFVDSLSSVLPHLLTRSTSQSQSKPIQLTVMGHSLGAYVAYELSRHLTTTSICTTTTTTTSSSTNLTSPNIKLQNLILVSPAATARTVSFSRALYFSLPPQSIVRRGGLLGFLLFTWKYPRSEAYTRDNLREFTYRLALQGPASGEAAIRPFIRFTGWRKAECVRPLSDVVRMAGVTDAIKQVRTLVIVGENDSSMPANDVVQLYHTMKAEGFDVDMHMFDRCDHCPQLEDPRRFDEVVKAFVASGSGCTGASASDGNRNANADANGIV